MGDWPAYLSGFVCQFVLALVGVVVVFFFTKDFCQGNDEKAGRESLPNELDLICACYDK